DNSVELNTITGMTYTCTTPPNKNAKTMACAPLDRFEISKSGYLGGASLSFVKPDGKGDLSYEWPIFFKYNRSCEKPIFSAKIRPGEDFLVGLSSAEYRGNTLARACNLRLIRKIPRSSLQ
ncbi:MAG: hypothetical protein LW855_04490, partial [Alphaproteobacteria bacterium]|nr:hypothetical protein [Alphaproteobacteria bacterium]